MDSLNQLIVEHWIGWIFSLIGIMIGYIYSKVVTVTRKATATENGIRALLRNDIIKAYNKCEERGYCPIYEMENIEEMYTQYHALGGNGTITELVERIQDLPTHPSDKTEMNK